MQHLVLYCLLIHCCLAEFWIIHIFTGSELDAGTDSNIYIRLFNARNESTIEYRLTHSNWVSDMNEIRFRDLFEAGAEERFRIHTKDIGSVAKIQIRRSIFPSFQADWLLNRVVVQRESDSVKYTFPCNCWLRKTKPYATISVLPDREPINQKRSNNLSLISRIFIIVLVLMAGTVCILYCYNEYCHWRDDVIHSPDHHELSVFVLPEAETSQPTVESQFPSSNDSHQWRNVLQELPCSGESNEAQSISIPTTRLSMIATDQPPSYEDLFPGERY